MAKRKRQPVPTGDSCAALEGRIGRLEKVIGQHFGAGIEELAEEPDDPVVDEKRFEHSVLRTHKSGKIEHVRICPHCKAEVHDLIAHSTVCRERSTY